MVPNSLQDMHTAQHFLGVAHIASDFTCVFCAAVGTFFGTIDVYELCFSYLSLSIFNFTFISEPSPMKTSRIQEDLESNSKIADSEDDDETDYSDTEMLPKDTLVTSKNEVANSSRSTNTNQEVSKRKCSL